jgi:hypothetical protein
MQFTNTILFAATALASMATAENYIQFINQCSTTKNIVFTANAGLEPIGPVVLEPLGSANQTIPPTWQGNFYSYDEGAENRAGMLGEVNFNAYNGATYFDISSIVNPKDNDGIKMLYPFGENPKLKETAVSGCQSQPCSNQYNHWDDIATLSTPKTALTCLVGNLAPTQRRRTTELFSRDFLSL